MPLRDYQLKTIEMLKTIFDTLETDRLTYEQLAKASYDPASQTLTFPKTPSNVLNYPLAKETFSPPVSSTLPAHLLLSFHS